MNETKAIFKPQFGEPSFLSADSSKNKKRDGSKTYSPTITSKRYIVWISQKETDTATEAIKHAKKILDRYTRLVDVAIRTSQNIQLDPDFLNVINNADQPESPAVG